MRIVLLAFIGFVFSLFFNSFWWMLAPFLLLAFMNQRSSSSRRKSGSAKHSRKPTSYPRKQYGTWSDKGSTGPLINPATGLPMFGGFDSAGNPFGFDNASMEAPDSNQYSIFDDDFTINPATGLPMIGGVGGIDVQGNFYGTDMHDHHHHNCSFPSDDFTS